MESPSEPECPGGSARRLRGPHMDTPAPKADSARGGEKSTSRVSNRARTRLMGLQSRRVLIRSRSARFRHASGPHSIAIGPLPNAFDARSTAVDPRAIASGPHSAALDPRATASGPRSTAIDPRATASGPRSTALDPLATASGPRSTALDPLATASGPRSTALDPPAIASGARSRPHDRIARGSWPPLRRRSPSIDKRRQPKLPVDSTDTRR